MLDRLTLRTTFWCVAVTLITVIVGSAIVRLQQHGGIGATPLLSALALAVTVAGWRRLHGELQRRTAADASLRERMRRLDEAMQASVDGVFLLRAVRDRDGHVRDLEITDVNRRGADLLYGDRETLIGQRLRRDLSHRNGETIFGRYAEAISVGAPLVEEVRVNRRRLAASWILHQATPTSDGVAVTVRDISIRKREEVRLRRASLTDDLTLLYNRRGFMALADQQLRLARRQGKDAVVMYADMDGFKQLNDTYGHAVGDRALVAVARVLQSTVRDCDVVARLGGDEFTVLALDADGVGARIIQRRIEERLAILNASGELPTPLALTIGHTRVRPNDPATVCELLARADQLLYARKRRRQVMRMVPTAPASRPVRQPATLAPTAVPASVAAVAAAMASSRGFAAPVPGTMSGASIAPVPGTRPPTQAA
ncbi:MAG: GGDEF domain-containing protein [Gemmatimonas sp.]|jgi:diguanylate cyclase (GGDEF)-like protein|uniref:GGDEF domain-containing protein n=1 Tax=Gemmatimonas sp. TaxID=1962908 RepID=UPI00391F72D9|nr:GGDEF domain-containing protein [Gemmatimonadota bacterium]